MEKVKKQGMESLFVPYEIALALKELGFDEPCFGYYLNREFNFFYNTIISERINSKTKDIFNSDVIVAPTYSQAFRWFRGKYGYFQLFDFQVGDSKITKGFFFSIINIHNEDFFFPEDFENIIYKTYEEAELECLKKLIEIVRTKATSV